MLQSKESMVPPRKLSNCSRLFLRDTISKSFKKYSGLHFVINILNYLWQGDNHEQTNIMLFRSIPEFPIIMEKTRGIEGRINDALSSV